MKADQIALELYSVRSETQHDMLGTLRRLAEMGFKNLEFAGYGNSTAGEVRKALDDLGMRAVAAHIGLAQFEASVAQALDEAQTLGCRYAVVPYLPVERRGADEVRRLAEQFNDWGARAQAEGLIFGYHNHDFEFAPLAGSTFLEILFGATDPSLVKLEFDVYWAAFAGRDPVEVIRHYGSRVRLLHMKDMASGAAKEMANVGDGILPWPEIQAAGASAGVEWYIIEHDRPADPLRDVERSLRYLEAHAE